MKEPEVIKKKKEVSRVQQNTKVRVKLRKIEQEKYRMF